MSSKKTNSQSILKPITWKTEFVVLKKSPKTSRIPHTRKWRSYLLVISSGNKYEAFQEFEGYLENIRDIFLFIKDKEERQRVLASWDDRKEIRSFLIRKKGKILAHFAEWVKRRKEGLCLQNIV